jgi:hypothetical protein
MWSHPLRQQQHEERDGGNLAFDQDVEDPELRQHVLIVANRVSNRVQHHAFVSDDETKNDCLRHHQKVVLRRDATRDHKDHNRDQHAQQRDHAVGFAFQRSSLECFGLKGVRGH